MKYTQKDVCRLLNVTRETLRFYEKEGILNPQINPQNQYRYYDDYQVYLLAECKRYQANEFSVDEISEMIHSDSLQDYIARMTKQQAYFEQKAAEYAWKEEYNRDYVMKLRMIPELLNRPFAGYHEAVVFIPEKKGRQLTLDPENIRANHFIMDHLEFTFMTAVFPDCRKEEYEWGFGIRKWLCDQLNLDVSMYRLLPGGEALSCIIDAADSWHFESPPAGVLLKYAEENNYTPAGPFYLRQLVKTNEADGVHRYFEAFLPAVQKR